MEINRLLFTDSEAVSGLTWGYLPLSYYARTHGWPPPRKLALYHANYTLGPDGIGQKFAQFREVDSLVRWGCPAYIWSIAKRIPGKLLKGRQRK
jgi:hypothetical protein